MDWSRKPYTTQARWHDSPDAPFVRSRWYVTDLPCIEGMTILNNRDYCDDPNSELVVGEEPVWKGNRRYNGRWSPPAGLTGKHVCHPEWFSTGEPWPVTLPDTEYGSDWIPLCCGRLGDAAEGGVSIGGAAGDTHTISDATAGGFVVGGQAGSRPAGVDPTQGGVEIGGAAGDLLDLLDPTAGGVVLGGTAGDTFTHSTATAGGLVVGGQAGSRPAGVDPTQGGIEIGGAAGDLLDLLDPTAGGVVLGGAAGDLLDLLDATAGGVSVGGAAGEYLVMFDPTAGGVVLGGAAGDLLDLLDATAGGVSVGGEAGDVFTPGTVSPGADCSTAGVCVTETTYGATSPAGLGQDWWTISGLVNGTTYYFSYSPNGVSDVGFALFDGGSCPMPTSLLPTFDHAGCYHFTAGSSGVWWARFTSGIMGPQAYTWKLSTTPC